MTEEVKKQGLSKGCLIGLIVVGILLLIIIIASITCYMKREDIAKFAVTTIISGAKESLASEPVPGVDTTQFNALADAFMQKLDETPLDGERYTAFFQKIQSIPVDEKVDSVEVVLLVEAMCEYFPELRERFPLWPPVDSTLVDDSVQMVE